MFFDKAKKKKTQLNEAKLKNNSAIYKANTL